MAGLLTQSQIERIHVGVLRVLDETGLQVESEPLLSLLGEFGGDVDLGARRVRFPVRWVERFLEESNPYDWSTHQPQFGCFAGIYACQYLDPETDRLEPFTEATFRDYIRAGNALKEIDAVSNLGIPFVVDGIPPTYGALAEKLHGWKYGAAPSGTVQFTGLCPYIEEMYARMADELGRPLGEVFRAVGYLVSPLRLARAECEQLLYFRLRGLRMGVGHLLSMGASAPITMVGAVVLSLAESLFIGMLNRALWGCRSFGVGDGGIMVMDMRTTRSMYGRPEQIVMSAMLGQMARWYGAGCGSQAGLTDAKEPSAQAGAQKAMSAVAGIHSCGGSSMDAGLLSTDEICSPEQLVYDNELAGAIRRMIQPIELSDESLATAEIAEVGPGGTFIGTELTAKRFRQEVWEPRIWDRHGLQDWLQSGGRRERDRVRDRLRELLATPEPEPKLSPECERDLRAIIARAIEADATSSQRA